MKTAGLLGVMVAAVVAAALTILVAMQVDGTSGTGSSATTSTPTTTQPAELGAPTRVTIPAIKVDAQLIPVGLKPDGAMQTPDFGLAAWYDKGPKPGQNGPAVVLAHVDSKAGPDVFYKLKELKPG